MLHHIERPQQQYPLRERPPVPVTLESLRDMMVELRTDVMGRLDRQDAGIRYLIQQQGFAVPGYLQPQQDDPGDEDAAVE